MRHEKMWDNDYHEEALFRRKMKVEEKKKREMYKREVCPECVLFVNGRCRRNIGANQSCPTYQSTSNFEQ